MYEEETKIARTIANASSCLVELDFFISSSINETTKGYVDKLLYMTGEHEEYQERCVQCVRAELDEIGIDPDPNGDLNLVPLTAWKEAHNGEYHEWIYRLIEVLNKRSDAENEKYPAFIRKGLNTLAISWAKFILGTRKINEEDLNDAFSIIKIYWYLTEIKSVASNNYIKTRIGDSIWTGIR